MFFDEGIIIGAFRYKVPMLVDDSVHVRNGWIESENEGNSSFFSFRIFFCTECRFSISFLALSKAFSRSSFWYPRLI